MKLTNYYNCFPLLSIWWYDDMIKQIILSIILFNNNDSNDNDSNDNDINDINDNNDLILMISIVII